MNKKKKQLDLTGFSVGISPYVRGRHTVKLLRKGKLKELIQKASEAWQRALENARKKNVDRYDKIDDE